MTTGQRVELHIKKSMFLSSRNFCTCTIYSHSAHFHLGPEMGFEFLGQSFKSWGVTCDCSNSFNFTKTRVTVLCAEILLSHKFVKTKRVKNKLKIF